MSARHSNETAISPSAVESRFDNVVVPDFEKSLVFCGGHGGVREDDKEVGVCA